MICGDSGSAIGILTWTVNRASWRPGAWTWVWTFAPVSWISTQNGHFDCAIVCCEYSIGCDGCGCEIYAGYGYDYDGCDSSCFYGCGYETGDDEICFDFCS